ncbi:MAG: hypothetical protein QM803_07015 [Rhodocyclaceae bacterium]
MRTTLTRAALCLCALSAHAETVSMPAVANYLDAERIASNIRSECSLPQYQASAIQKTFSAAGITLSPSDADAVPQQGIHLVPQIASAYSGGHAFLGHRKQVQLMADLYVNGKKTATFNGTRNSMGGVMAGFSSSCDVLERCADSLSTDLLKWFRQQRITMSVPPIPAAEEPPAP